MVKVFENIYQGRRLFLLPYGTRKQAQDCSVRQDNGRGTNKMTKISRFKQKFPANFQHRREPYKSRWKIPHPVHLHGARRLRHQLLNVQHDLHTGESHGGKLFFPFFSHLINEWNLFLLSDQNFRGDPRLWGHPHVCSLLAGRADSGTAGGPRSVRGPTAIGQQCHIHIQLHSRCIYSAIQNVLYKETIEGSWCGEEYAMEIFPFLVLVRLFSQFRHDRVDWVQGRWWQRDWSRRNGQ